MLLECVTLGVGTRLAELFCDCQEIQVREFTELKKKYFRLRVSIRVLEALRRVVVVDAPFYGRVSGLIQY